MKTAVRLTVLSATFVVALGFASFINVSAQSASQQQISQIKINCLSIKNTLNQLLVSDTLLRVNMGQRYELISTKLMDRFNSRVATNNLNIDNLSSSSGGYKSQLEAFRADYIAYDDKLMETIKIDCLTQPSEFYDSLVATRTKRMQVYDDIKGLDVKIDQYRSAVSDFEKKYQLAGGK